MGREVGGGFRMWDTCTPMADSRQCMAKPIQYCKVINFQLNKLKKKEFRVESERPYLSVLISLPFLEITAVTSLGCCC